MNRLAMKIKEARLKANLTEKEVAKKAGIEIGYLLQIESGKKVINEQIADKILAALGTKEDFIKEEPKKNEESSSRPKIQKPGSVSPVAPNAQWESVLAGVVQKYPVVGEQSGKVLGTKELSILGKKVDSIHFEKLMLVQVESPGLPKLRIHKGDIVSLQKINAIENNHIYYFDYQQKKQFGMLRVVSGNKVLILKEINDPSPAEVPLKSIELIGKAIKVEFTL